MKKLFCLLLALACLMSVSAVGVFADEAGDGDIPSVDAFGDLDSQRYYYDGVEYCVENGLMNGLSATAFGPNDSMNRAMFVTVLWRMAGEPAVAEGFAGTAFTDVPEACYYKSAVEWAVSNDIVRGMSETLFGPDVLITREMMCTLMVRYAEYMGYGMYGTIGEDMTPAWYMVEAMFAEVDTVLYPGTGVYFVFSDTIEMSNYALASVYSCYEMGVINGVTETEFDPKGTATRGQVATVLKRFLYNVAYEITSATEGNVTTYTYTDPYGNVTATTVETADEEGNIISVVFTEGDYTDTVTYTYDEAGNLISDKYESSDGTSYTTTYDPETGDMVCEYGDGSKEAYTFDEFGFSTVTYTSEGEEEGYSYKDETEIIYSYDDEGTLTGLTVNQYGYFNYNGEESEYTSVSKIALTYDANGDSTGYTMSVENEEGVVEEMLSVKYDAERTRYDMTINMLGETITAEFSKAHNAVVMSMGGETVAMTLEEFFAEAGL